MLEEIRYLQIFLLVVLIKRIPSFKKKDKSEPELGKMIISGLAEAYAKQPTSAARIRVLSAVAPHMAVKELQETFEHPNKQGVMKPCTAYEITKAKIHNKVHGATCDVPKSKPVTRVCTPVEDIAFLLEFIHSPESVARSSHKTASCEGKKGSWISELMGGGT